MRAEAALAFPQQLPTVSQADWVRVVEAKEAAELAAKRAALQKTIAAGAQAIYLQAAQKQRSGDTGEAGRLYELIMEHFPKDPFAVKAADQLTAMSRADASRAASNRSTQDVAAPKSPACSHLYERKTVNLSGFAGISASGEVRGIGSSTASVRYWHPLLKETMTKEFDCSTL